MISPDRQLIDFVRVSDVHAQRSAHGMIEYTKPLGVGGIDGQYQADKDFAMLRFHRHGYERRVGFVIKLFNPTTPADDIRNSVLAYEEARRFGISVPPTTRYFELPNRRRGILMTDMREHGTYTVWGYNDNPSKQEQAAFKNLHIENDDIQTIEREVNSQMEIAIAHHRLLSFFQYHIRRNTRTHKISVIILDLDDNFLYTSRFDYTGLNIDERDNFLTLVRKHARMGKTSWFF